jgi:hypothetical protein
MSANINNIIAEVVPGTLQEVIKKQKYPSAKAFYTIGGSSLGVWLFNGVGAGIIESFTGKESYIAYNCDAWLKVSALILALVVAFVGAEYLKLKTMYDRLVSFFTGLLIFFCATSINTSTAYFFETKNPPKIQTSQMGMLPFRNPSWFPPKELVNEVEIKEAQNQKLEVKNEESVKFVKFVEQELEKAPNSCSQGIVNKSNTPNSSNTKNEILNNLANYKASVEKIQQSNQPVSLKANRTQKQIAVDAENEGFNAIIAQDFTIALKTFEQAYQAWDIYHNVDEINQLLQKKKNSFSKVAAERKNIIWQEIYCEIALKYQWGMTIEIRNKFQHKMKTNNYVCSQNQMIK